MFEQDVVDGREEAESEALCASQVLRACGWLRGCERLEHLELGVNDPFPVHTVLAAIGAAIGGQLRSLTIVAAEVPRTRAAAAKALYTLAASFPRLEELALQLCVPDDMDAHAGEMHAAELLAPAPALAPLCPLLRSVRVEPSPHVTMRRITEAVWLRPGA